MHRIGLVGMALMIACANLMMLILQYFKNKMKNKMNKMKNKMNEPVANLVTSILKNVCVQLASQNSLLVF